MKRPLLLLLLCSSLPVSLLAQRRVYLQTDAARQLRFTNQRDTAYARISKGKTDMGLTSEGSYTPRTDVPDGAYEFYVDKQLRLSAFMRGGKPDSSWIYYRPGGEVRSTVQHRTGWSEEWSFDATTGQSMRTWHYPDACDFTVYYYGRESKLPASYSWSTGTGPLDSASQTFFSFSLEADGLLAGKRVESKSGNPLVEAYERIKKGRLQGKTMYAFAYHQWDLQFDEGRLTGWRLTETRTNKVLVKWGAEVKND